MSASVETICVDIGNSGLRCMRLAAAAQSPSDRGGTTVPWTGTILRIDWPLAGRTPASPQADTLRTDNLQPDYPQTGQLSAGSPESIIGEALECWLSASASSLSASSDRRWIVSSVQRDTERHLRRCVDQAGGGEYRLLSRGDVDLEVDVDAPDRVGLDRLLAALAALEHSPTGPIIVIQAGSAITVDWVEAPRRFCGGAIMPGVPMMLRLLSRAADMLPEVAAEELLELPPLPGRDTAAAMSAGVSSAVVGGVQHLVGRYRSQFGAAVPIVLSGGDGPRLAPHLTPPLFTVDQLVLRGLAICARSSNCA